MSNLGIGVMLKMLSSNSKTVEALKVSIGKEITALKIIKEDDGRQEDRLLFTFVDGSQMEIQDGGRSCCEERYMHTDDALQDFVGSTLDKVEIRDAPTTQDDYGDPHEVQFLVVTTNKGAFTIETHNIHNGYYGGFAVEALLVRKADDSA
jgi:hypothetical protein